MTIVNCKECNKEFDKDPCRIEASPNNFCSRSCAITYNNRGKQRNPPKTLICVCCKNEYVRTKEYNNRNYCSLLCKEIATEEIKNSYRETKLNTPNRKCPFCKLTKDKECFISKSGIYQTYCKQCCAEEKLKKIRELKIKAVDYCGGCCQHCGYKKYIGSLEFHHKNPADKKFSISNSNLVKFNDQIKKELDKCILLCGNCHREEHARLKGILI